jgi:hypothetical protein
MSALDDAVQFGGIVLAHAAWVVSGIEEGSVLCPFMVLQTGHERRVIAFESPTQAESVRRGEASFLEQKDSVDFWGFAWEGFLSYPGSDRKKHDVLTVSSWGRNLDEPILLRQRFVPNTRGPFQLVGPIEIAIHGMVTPEPIQTSLRSVALQGVQQHSQGGRWGAWTSD